MKARGLHVSLLLMCMATASGYAQVQHFGMSPEQQFLLCAQSVLGKPILWQAVFYRERQDAPTVPQVACPDSREHFIEALQKNEAISVFEDDRFAFLVTRSKSPARGPNNIYYSYDWKRLRVDFHVMIHRGAGSQALSEAEQNTIVSAILHNVRGVEVFDVVEPSELYGSDTGFLQVRLELDVTRLGEGAPESVLGFLYASTNADPDSDPEEHVVRLIYGEMREGSYVPLWDSPLMYAPHPWVSYQDLDGDGIREIVVWPPQEEIEQLSDHVSYAIGFISFDKNGHELTRRLGTLCEDDKACPVWAQRFSLVSQTGRKKDVLALHWAEHPHGISRFTVKNGSFSYVGQPRRSTTKVSPAIRGVEESKSHLTNLH